MEVGGGVGVAVGGTVVAAAESGLAVAGSDSVEQAASRTTANTIARNAMAIRF